MNAVWHTVKREKGADSPSRWLESCKSCYQVTRGPRSKGPAERSLDNHRFLGTNSVCRGSPSLLAAVTAGAHAEILFPAPSSCLCFPRGNLKDFLTRIQKKHYQFFKSIFPLNCQLFVIFFFSAVKKVILSLYALSIQQIVGEGSSTGGLAGRRERDLPNAYLAIILAMPQPRCSQGGFHHWRYDLSLPFHCSFSPPLVSRCGLSELIQIQLLPQAGEMHRGGD